MLGIENMSKSNFEQFGCRIDNVLGGDDM